MFKYFSSLLSATAVAATLLAGTSLTGPAAAQTQCKWQMPSSPRIQQGNNHSVYLKYNAAGGYWTAKAYNGTRSAGSSTEVVFTSVTPRLVKFIITWINGSAGIYTGTIDEDGFASGITRDRFNAQSKTTWDMTTRMRCR